MKATTDILDRIKESIDNADKAIDNWIQSGPRASDYRSEQEDFAEYFFDLTFLELQILCEAKNLSHLLKLIESEQALAKKNCMRLESDVAGNHYSFWAMRLRQIVRALDTSFGAPALSTVTKELIDILRATSYSITDSRCFDKPPRSEKDVHARIEAVLRCVFPDLRHKPPIGKPIKCFEPDTGLPAVQTLIEYKFVATPEDVKRVADELLADTRGYVSKEWSRFIFVVYETKRLRREAEWIELMRTSGVGEDVQVIVICGENPRNRGGRTTRAPGTSGTRNQ